MWKASEITKKNGWLPFRVASKGDPVRGLSSSEGVADRLRLVCFAELQARDVFLSGIERFTSQAPAEWIDAWRRFSEVEDRHAQMLLDRMSELGVDPAGRFVSDKLTKMCEAAGDPVLFLFLLSSAEERGMEAGFVLGEQMKAVDPESASVFARIAAEEVEHVAMARNALSGRSPEELQARARIVSAKV